MVPTNPKPGSLGRAAVYSRISNPDSVKDTSLDKQEQATVQHMRSLGYTVEDGDIYRERCTGKDQYRPVLIHIKTLMREGRYKAIGFYCLDRLVRSQVHTAVLFDELDKLKVVPISATNDIGDNTPEGKLILAIRAYLAESERLKIEDRMGGAKRFLRESGKFLKLGATKFGYEFLKEERRRTAREDEAGVVRRIFEASAAGDSFGRIAAGLTNASVPTPSSGRGKRGKTRNRWNDSLVRDVVRDPTYKGWTIMGRYRRLTAIDEATGRRTRTVEHLPPEEWIVLDRDGKITEAIVTPELWEEANRRAVARRRNEGPSRTAREDRETHLLGGLAFCGKCGQRLYCSSGRCSYVSRKTGRRSGTVRRFYLCRSRHGLTKNRTGECGCGTPSMGAAELDAAAWLAFRLVVITPGLVEEAAARVESESDTSGVEGELAAAGRVLAEKTRTRNTIYEKWRKEVDDADGDPEFADKLEADYRSMRAPIEAHKEAVRTLEDRLAAIRRAPGAADNFRARFEALRQRLLVDDDTTFAERAEALKLASVRVVAMPGHLDIYADLFDDSASKPVEISRSFAEFTSLPLLISSRRPVEA